MPQCRQPAGLNAGSVLLRVVVLLAAVIPAALFSSGISGAGARADTSNRCPAAIARTAPWNATCYRTHVPPGLLRSAPFPVIDPRASVYSVTHLPLRGIYVARLGTDFDRSLSPLHGPAMMIEYVFGAPPPVEGIAHGGGRSFSVWEDGYQLDSGSGSTTAHGWHVDSLSFPNHLLEMQVRTDGPSHWLTTVSSNLSSAVQAQPVRSPPPLRLYARAPGTRIRVRQAVAFLVLNNAVVARRPAAFDLVLHGGWKGPRVIAAYEGSACGGDNVPRAVRKSHSRWTLDFGDCKAVTIVLTPTTTGPHSVRIRTYALDASSAGSRQPVRNGGFDWTGTVST